MNIQDLCTGSSRLTKELLDSQQPERDSGVIVVKTATMRRLLRQLDRTLKSMTTMSENSDQVEQLPMEDLLRFVVSFDTKVLNSELASIVSRITNYIITLLFRRGEEVLPSSDDMVALINKIVARNKQDDITNYLLILVNYTWETQQRVPNVVVTNQWSLWLDNLLPKAVESLEYPFFQENDCSISQSRQSLQKVQCNLRFLALSVLEQTLSQVAEETRLQIEDRDGSLKQTGSILRSQDSSSACRSAFRPANLYTKPSVMDGALIFFEKNSEYTLDLLDAMAIMVQGGGDNVVLDVVHQCASRATFASRLITVVGKHAHTSAGGDSDQILENLRLSSISILEVMVSTSFLKHRDADVVWVEALVEIARNTRDLGDTWLKEEVFADLIIRTLPYPSCCSNLLSGVPHSPYKESKSIQRILQLALILLQQGTTTRDNLPVADELQNRLRVHEEHNHKPDLWDKLAVYHLTNH